MDQESRKLKQNLEDLSRYLLEKVEDEKLINDGKVDHDLKSLSDLMKLAVESNQTDVPLLDSNPTYIDVTRVVRLRLKLSREEIRTMFGIEPVSIYGEGLYFPVEGILLPPSFRSESGYDDYVEGKRKAHYEYLKCVPKEVADTHEFRLTVPAIRRHVFVPKKSRLMDWVVSTRAIQFFDPTCR